jgi:hypothetical protein
MVWKWVTGTWTGRVAGVALPVALLISLYWWPDSGFDAYHVNENIQRAKTLWDWLALLGVPVVIAVGGYLFSRAERKNEKEIEAERARQERAVAEERAKLERELANKRADEDRNRSEDALRQALVQDYLDRMAELLLDKGLATSAPEDPVRDVARARTLTVLRGLGEDGARKGYIVQFLYETGLIRGEPPIVELKGANLQHADLTGVNLAEVNLLEANFAAANFSRAVLSRAVLSRAVFTRANFSGANLSGAQLSQVSLDDANLSGAILRRTDIRASLLRGVALTGADLRNASVANEQLSLAASLDGATMPDGTKYAGVPPTAVTPSELSPDDSPQGTQPNP